MCARLLMKAAPWKRAQGPAATLPQRMSMTQLRVLELVQLQLRAQARTAQQSVNNDLQDRPGSMRRGVQQLLGCVLRVVLHAGKLHTPALRLQPQQSFSSVCQDAPSADP